MNLFVFFALAVAIFLALLGRVHAHCHDWYLMSTSISGWSVYKCRTCGKTDIG